jgi:hypothetical protein
MQSEAARNACVACSLPVVDAGPRGRSQAMHNTSPDGRSPAVRRGSLRTISLSRGLPLPQRGSRNGHSMVYDLTCSEVRLTISITPGDADEADVWWSAAARSRIGRRR